ncbi:uncharacterized protein isoform X2 [Takifugu rubripes]|uniref:uncharacterized protein isoform X2 n=1 Tax=Takifugu rubripes TaxID=31033 RepID=UPI0011460680|nr:vacuole membrane protein 1 isoform X2 [Takifugu rubripes]
MAGVVRLSGADPDDAEYQPRTRGNSETVAAHTFRRHMVEQIGPISGALSLLGAALQKPYREYWEAQKAKPHHHTGEGTPTNLALVSVRTPGDVMRSDLWAALRDPAFLQFSKDSHTLSTMKMTTSTHPPPHPALRLWLETQHANPACSNRLVGVTFKSSYWLYPSSFSLYIHYIEPPNPGVLLKCAATTHPLIPPPPHTHTHTCRHTPPSY